MMRFIIQWLLIGVLVTGTSWLFLDALARVQNDIVVLINDNSGGLRGGEQALKVVGDVRFSQLAQLSQTLSRPIFFRERRVPRREPAAESAPQVPAPVASVRASVNVERFKLSGIQILADSRSAYLAGADGVFAWRRVGDKFDGWEIVKIEPGHVELGQGGQTATLDLYDVPRGN